MRLAPLVLEVLAFVAMCACLTWLAMGATSPAVWLVGGVAAFVWLAVFVARTPNPG